MLSSHVIASQLLRPSRPAAVASESKSKPETSSLFAMRTFSPGSLDKIELESDDMAEVVKSEYLKGVIKALIKEAGGNVIDFDNFDINNSFYVFTRDIGIVLDDLQILLASKEFNQSKSTTELLNAIKKQFNYQLITIPDVRFIGGDIFYLPQHKVLFYGVHPSKEYKSKTVLHDKLSCELKPRGVNVMPLELAGECTRSENFYYHLDCLMEALPDGRLIILNKKLFTSESYRKLQTLLGPKLIDLEYEDYELKPVMLNFIAVKKGDKITCVSPSLPKELIEKLRKLNLDVITSDMLDPTQPELYSPLLCKKVCKHLIDDNFLDINPESLLLNAHSRKYHPALFYPCRPLLSKEERQLLMKAGGPHCLTLEVQNHPLLSQLR